MMGDDEGRWGVKRIVKDDKKTYLLLSDSFILKENNKILRKTGLSVFQNYASNFYKKGINNIGHTYFNYFKEKDFSELKCESFKRINNKTVAASRWLIQVRR